MKCRDYVGCRIRLQQQVKTKAHTFPEGSEGVIRGTWRGRYNVDMDGGHTILGLRIYTFSIVERPDAPAA